MGLYGILLNYCLGAVGPVTVLVYALNVPVVRAASTRPAAPVATRAASVNESAEGLLLGAGLMDDGRRHSAEAAPTHTAAAAALKTTECHAGPEPAAGPRSVLEYCRHVCVTTYKIYLGRGVFHTGLVVCALKTIGLDVQIIQTQCSAWRFCWTFSAVTYANAYATLLCMLVVASLPPVVLPLADRLGTQRATELPDIRASLALRAAGTLAMGLAPTRGAFLAAVAVQALSAGIYNTFKSFLAGCSSSAHVARSSTPSSAW